MSDREHSFPNNVRSWREALALTAVIAGTSIGGGFLIDNRHGSIGSMLLVLSGVVAGRSM